MFKFILMVVVVCRISFADGENMIGPGKWKIYHINYIEGLADELKIDLTQKKLDRSTYGYSGTIECLEPWDERYAMNMEVCKYVDGGCKQFQVLQADSFVDFIYEFAEDNIRECFKKFGSDGFPLDVGKHEVEDFIFDTNELPENCTYGRYIAETCAMKNGVPCGCIEIECEFYQDEEE